MSLIKDKTQRTEKRAAAVLGTGGDCLPIAAVPNRTNFPDRIFITKIAREVDSKRILNYVLQISKKVKSVTKMKPRTQSPTFASFVVELEKGEGKIANDPSIWSKGAEVRIFRGRPLQEQVEEVVYNEAYKEEHSATLENPAMDITLTTSSTGDS